MAERKKTRLRFSNDSIDPRLITPHLCTWRCGGDTLSMRVDSAYLMGVTACVLTDRLLPMVKKEYAFTRIFPRRYLTRCQDVRRLCRNMKYLFF